MTTRKCDSFQFNEALIQVVEWHLKIIFCLLTNPNFVIGEFEKLMFQVIARLLELIFSS